MRLHEDEALFRQAIIATADFMGIPEIFIEKDYWVTYALYAIGGQAGCLFFLSDGFSILFLYTLERGEIQDIPGTFKLAGFGEDFFVYQIS